WERGVFPFALSVAAAAAKSKGRRSLTEITFWHANSYKPLPGHIRACPGARCERVLLRRLRQRFNLDTRTVRRAHTGGKQVPVTVEKLKEVLVTGELIASLVQRQIRPGFECPDKNSGGVELKQEGGDGELAAVSFDPPPV